MVGRRAVIGVWLSHRWQLCPSCGYCIFLIFLYSVAYQRVYIFFIRLPKFIPSLFFGEDRLSVGAIILSRKGQIGSQVLSFQVWISKYISRFKIFNVLFSLYFVCICLCYVLSVHVCLICLFQYWFCLVMTFIFKISFIWGFLRSTKETTTSSSALKQCPANCTRLCESLFETLGRLP